MIRLSPAVKVGILTIAMVVGSYAAFKSLGGKSRGESSLALWAKLKDASGLPEGSLVVVAGVPIGEIGGRSLEGRYARVSFVISDDVEVWSNAVAYKKAASMLGNFYIEIDPGTPSGLDTAGKVSANRRLGHGEQIQHVVEVTTPEEVMKRFEASRPKLDAALLSARDLSEDWRRLVDGPVASATMRINRTVEEETGTVRSIIRRGERVFAGIDLVREDIRVVTGVVDTRATRILEQFDEAASEGRELVDATRREVDQTRAKAAEKLDLLDEVSSRSTSIVNKIEKGNGSLARFVGDSRLAKNIEDISEEAKGFVGTLLGIQTYVGLRSEYMMRGGGIRSYVKVEILTRPDKFYLVEFVKAPSGGYPEISLEFDPDRGQFERNVLIEDKIRFTFQFAKRISWATFRYGIKESSPGIGFDGHWFEDRLQLSLDLFDGAFDDWPRLKVAAAYEVFRHVYILGGIDEALNAPGSLTISSDELEVPVMFEEFTYGRDYFLGAQLRFNDRDLSALLFIGGSAVAAFGK